MQIFLVGTVLETAKCLDNRRFNKQIIEVRQIISAIEGKTISWRNHPVTIMYKEHYSQYFPHAVESYSNFYYVDSEWKEYKQK